MTGRMRRPPRLPDADLATWVSRVWAGSDGGRVRTARPVAAPAAPAVHATAAAAAAAAGLAVVLAEVATSGYGQGTAHVSWAEWPMAAAWYDEAGTQRAWPSATYGAWVPGLSAAAVDGGTKGMPQCSGGVLAWTLGEEGAVVGATVWVAVAVDTDTDWYDGVVRHQLQVVG